MAGVDMRRTMMPSNTTSITCLLVAVLASTVMLNARISHEFTPDCPGEYYPAPSSTTGLSINGNAEMDAIFASNGTSGLTIDDSYQIQGLSFHGSGVDVHLSISNTNRFLVISDCTFRHARTGIVLSNVSNVFIVNTTFHNHSITAVSMDGASSCVVEKAHFQGNTNAMRLAQGSSLHIVNNTYFQNQVAVSMGYVSSMNFTANVIVGNNIGITMIDSCIDNRFWNNYFVENGIHASDPWATNQWDNGTAGNYWSDYTHKYPGATIVDGAWDTSYLLLEYFPGIHDHFPVPRCTYPFPFFTATPRTVATGEPVNFNYTGIHEPGPVQFRWSFGDETTIAGDEHDAMNITRSFSIPGPRTITLVVSSTGGRERQFIHLDMIVVEEGPAIPGTMPPIMLLVMAWAVVAILATHPREKAKGARSA